MNYMNPTRMSVSDAEKLALRNNQRWNDTHTYIVALPDANGQTVVMVRDKNQKYLGCL